MSTDDSYRTESLLNCTAGGRVLFCCKLSIRSQYTPFLPPRLRVQPKLGKPLSDSFVKNPDCFVNSMSAHIQLWNKTNASIWSTSNKKFWCAPRGGLHDGFSNIALTCITVGLLKHTQVATIFEVWSTDNPNKWSMIRVRNKVSFLRPWQEQSPSLDSKAFSAWSNSFRYPVMVAGMCHQMVTNQSRRHRSTSEL